MKRSIGVREGIGTTAALIQRREALLSHVFNPAPAIVIVKRGRKTLRSSGRTWVVDEGQAVAAAGGTSFDVINQPSDLGAYESVILTFDGALIDRGCDVPAIRSVMPLGRPEDAFVESFERARAAILNTAEIPEEIAAHRQREVLAWIRLHGGFFTTSPAPSLSTRLRHLFASAPAFPWTSARVTERVAMSEASLRRHLADEGSSLSEILIDVRMGTALAMIQATDTPIWNIAQAVGYDSASRFAVRFKRRFGFSPSVLRGRGRSPQNPVKR